MTAFTDKELQLLDHIGNNAEISQRELSKNTGISLGLINVIIQKFIKTGYIQVSHLNKRKLRYLVTPLGLVETARRSYRFATKTIRNYLEIQANLSSIIQGLQQEGYEYFSIHGDGDLKILLQSIFQDSENNVNLGEEHREDSRSVVLKVGFEPLKDQFLGNVVNVLEKIGERQ